MNKKHPVDVMVEYPDGTRFKRCTIHVTNKRFEEIKDTIANLTMFSKNLEGNCGGYIP